MRRGGVVVAGGVETVDAGGAAAPEAATIGGPLGGVAVRPVVGGRKVTRLESDGGDQFFCGGAKSGKVRAVRRPRRAAATGS